MKEDLNEINNMSEGKDNIAKKNKVLTDENEPLDLGKPHIMSDKEYEDFKKSLEDNKVEKTDIIESKNVHPKGYLDDKGKWHGNLDDEPLFGKDGNLRTLNKEEIPLTDEEKKGLKKGNTDLEKDSSNKDLEKNKKVDDKTKKTETVKNSEKIEEPYIDYEKTEDYKDRAINGTGEDLHKGFINYLRNNVKEDIKEDLQPINDEYKK